MSRTKTADYFGDEGGDAPVRNITTYDVVKDCLVDARKELADVAFQHPTGAGVIAGDLVCKLPEALHCSVGTLSLPT